MSAKPVEKNDKSAREIVISRIVDAPRDLVWDTWTTPEKVAKWWGPNGFTNTIYEMDVRPGGVWRYMMHGPDGTDYPNHVEYREVVRPERLVYSHGEDASEKSCHFHTTATFEDVAGKTRVTLRMLFPTVEERNAKAKFGAIEGGQQTLERLDTWVALQRFQTGSAKAFEFQRTFDAPRDTMWQAHANAAALGKWWGPKGSKITVQTHEFKPGGLFHYVMRYSTGAEMWGRFIYREIVEPRRIVFVNSFSDASGGIVRAPFSATWPLEVLNVITFDELAGKTLLTLKGGPIGATAAEQRNFEDMFSSMTQGFGGTFDQLAEFLAQG